MTELMRDSLVLARNLGMDVFNALNLMQNQEFLQVRAFPPRAVRRKEGRVDPSFLLNGWQNTIRGRPYCGRRSGVECQGGYLGVDPVGLTFSCWWKTSQASSQQHMAGPKSPLERSRLLFVNQGKQGWVYLSHGSAWACSLAAPPVWQALRPSRLVSNRRGRIFRRPRNAVLTVRAPMTSR